MMLRIVLMLGCLLSLIPLEVRAAVQTTTVAGTVYRADGSVAAGTLLVSWPAFVTADGNAVAAGTTTIQIGTDGGMSVALAPNEGAAPAGTYYTAVYHLSDGTVNKEYWLVPQVPNATLAAIRAKVVPAAVAVAMTGSGSGSVSTVYQLMSANFLPLGGGTLNGPLTLSGQPTAAGQAVSKSYVDTALGGITAASLGALPLSGGTVSGDIIAKDGSPVASEAYVAQHAGSGIAAASGTLGSVQINNGQGSLGTDLGLTMDTTNHILSIPGEITMGSEENAPRGTYDPMNPKYAGGLGNATTPDQQTAVMNAVLNEAGCDVHMGKVHFATVVYPASITGMLHDISIPANVTLKCSVDSQYGSCHVEEPLANDSGGPVSQTTGHTIFIQSNLTHGMCGGVDTVYGSNSSRISGFDLFGQGSPAGALDIGINSETTSGIVEHITANNFGGPAVIIGGMDSTGEWINVQNAPTYFIDNPAIVPNAGYAGAVECIAGDVICEHMEISTGAPFERGSYSPRPANYPDVPALAINGGAGRISHIFTQVSDVGMYLAFGTSGAVISDSRIDLMAGTAIYSASGGNVITGVAIQNPCMDSSFVDATSHVSSCAAITDGSQNSYSGITAFPIAGFGASYVGAMFSAGNSPVSEYNNGFPVDQYGNGKDFDGKQDLFGGGAAAGTPQITSSCSFNAASIAPAFPNGPIVVPVNGCAHIQLTDTTPVNVQFFYGIGDGKTITIEGTAKDTLVYTAGSVYGEVGVETCSGANVQLGNGPLEFFYTTRDSLLHQVCDGTKSTAAAPGTASTTDPQFSANGNGEAEMLTGTASVGTIFTVNHNNHSWYWYCTDGTGCGVYDTVSGLQLMQMRASGSTPYVSTGVVALSAGTPASSTPTGGCVANSVWADDSYLYHCSSDGATVKRAALSSF